MISNALDNKSLPIYGDGQQVRDWLYVEDHCRAVYSVLNKGRAGEIYNVGGNCSLPNLEVVRRILKATGRTESLLTRVADRPGHDRRYALTNEKLTRETGWAPKMDFDRGLAMTVDWYKQNRGWVERVKSGEYQRYYSLNYANRAL
jgi:dTDP-glucose 4,6-dehydratase